MHFLNFKPPLQVLRASKFLVGSLYLSFWSFGTSEIQWHPRRTCIFRATAGSRDTKFVWLQISFLPVYIGMKIVGAWGLNILKSPTLPTCRKMMILSTDQDCWFNYFDWLFKKRMQREKIQWQYLIFRMFPVKKMVSRMTKKASIFMPQLFFLQDFPANAKPSEIEKWQLSKVNLATKIISKYHVKGQTKRGLRCPWSSLNRAGWWTIVNHPSISGKVVEIDFISQIGVFKFLCPLPPRIKHRFGIYIFMPLCFLLFPSHPMVSA